MKTKSRKEIYGLSIVVAILCTLRIIWVIIESFNYLGIGELLVMNSSVIWSEEIMPIQITVFICRIVFNLLFSGAICIFLFNLIKENKNGVIFPHKNIIVLYIATGSFFVSSICNQNIAPLLHWGENAPLVINVDTVLYTILLLIFAFIYKIAVNISEENNLTI